MANMTIEGKVLGQKRKLFTDWAVPLPPDDLHQGRSLILRDLITYIVQQEVEQFKARQEQRRLEHFLSKEAITEGVKRGKVDMGGRDLQQEVNGDAAIGTALQAFEDGLYYVFVDDHQYTSLDNEVFLKIDSKILFVRLVALAGG